MVLTIIRTHHLTKSFQGKEVVSNVHMKVNKGEIYGLLGPNGAGKTTIMRMLINLVKPSAGEIELFGETLTPSSHQILKRMGSMIEHPIFYDKLSARENMELHCEYMGYYHPRAIDEALELVSLQHTGDKAVKEFSLGMKQRLGIARAISTKPELIILDEPINGLDPVGIKSMRKLFTMLCKEMGITIILSSHILAEIEQVADTVGVINHGRLVAEVPMEQVRQQHTEYIELSTPEMAKAAYVLDDILKLTNFIVTDEGIIRVYDPQVTQNDISKALVLNDISIEGLTKKSTSLEDYFMNLIKEDKQHV